MTSCLPFKTTLRTKARCAISAAANMSSLTWLWQRLPAREWESFTNWPLWLYMIVLYEATPGRTDLRLPEKPAKKCGSMKPSASSRSASTATLLMMHSPPEGRVPTFSIMESSVATCMTISSSATIFSPYLLTSSSWVEGRCMPVATRMRTRASGAAVWMRRSRMGMVTREGTGRV